MRQLAKGRKALADALGLNVSTINRLINRGVFIAVEKDSDTFEKAHYFDIQESSKRYEDHLKKYASLQKYKLEEI